jgi:methyl-accepting chemotaxis protein
MKKIYTFFIILILSVSVYSQNENVVTTDQKALQNEQEIILLKKKLNRMNYQVRNLKTQIKTITDENNKKIDELSENVKSLNDKVIDANGTINQLKEEFATETQLNKTRLDNISHALQKLKYFTFIVFFLIALFIVIVTYYFNSKLNKKVNIINELIQKIKENVYKQFEEFRNLEDKLLKENNGFIEDNIKRSVDLLSKKIDDNKDLLYNDLQTMESKFTGDINRVNELFNKEIKGSNVTLKNKILKNTEETKTWTEEQIAMLKEDFAKEIKKHKHNS